eukprot:TRINITY_DN46_c0_g1_i9.p1 TRINITY_DN46_c0_g1~~TRINITY_DN46_c0_g1_i9.p1  ORF type:complete len:384 (+),score=90.05 TRINITY_DN46_c0_g1_i9:414-1565(+)
MPSEEELNDALAAASRELGGQITRDRGTDDSELREDPGHCHLQVTVWLNPQWEKAFTESRKQKGDHRQEATQRLHHADALLVCYSLLTQGCGFGDGTSDVRRALDRTHTLCEDKHGRLHWQFKDHESAKQAMDILDGRGVWDNDRNMLAIVFTATWQSIKPAKRILDHCTAEACYELGGQAPISYVYCRLIAALRADRNSGRFLPRGARVPQMLVEPLSACTPVEAVALVGEWQKTEQVPKCVHDTAIRKLATALQKYNKNVFTVWEDKVSVVCDEMYVAVLRQCENASSVTPFLQYARQLEGLLKEADIQRFEALYRQRRSKAGYLFGVRWTPQRDDVDRLRSRVDVWEQLNELANEWRSNQEIQAEADEPMHPSDWPCAYV